MLKTIMIRILLISLLAGLMLAGCAMDTDKNQPPPPAAQVGPHGAADVPFHD